MTMRTRAKAKPPIDRPLGRKVPADGPKTNVDVMFIGEAPGIAEEMAGKPFVGKTGKEMYRLCKQAGIDFSKCRRTNVVLYRPYTRTATGNNPPSREEIKRDEPELIREIQTIRPRFIAAVGRTAAVWFLGDVDVEDTESLAFPLPERTIAKICGSGQPVRETTGPGNNLQRADTIGKVSDGVRAVQDEGESKWLKELRVIVLRHPAAGLHSPEAQPVILYNFLQLGKYVSGKLKAEPPINRYPDPDYYEPRGTVSLSNARKIAIDTEGLRGKVWGLSYTQIAGSAGVIRAVNKKALNSFKEQLLGGR